MPSAVASTRQTRARLNTPCWTGKWTFRFLTSRSAFIQCRNIQNEASEEHNIYSLESSLGEIPVPVQFTACLEVALSVVFLREY